MADDVTRHRADRPDMIRSYIAQHTIRYGYAPSIAEIAAAVGLASKASVHHHLRKLRAAGLVSEANGQARAHVLPRTELTPEAVELAWCLSVHGSRAPKVRPCKRHRLMAEWLVDIVLPRARAIAAVAA